MEGEGKLIFQAGNGKGGNGAGEQAADGEERRLRPADPLLSEYLENPFFEAGTENHIPPAPAVLPRPFSPSAARSAIP